MACSDVSEAEAPGEAACASPPLSIERCDKLIDTALVRFVAAACAAVRAQ